MTTSPIVSVVIPTFNRESMLPGAIDSVLAQTYGNVEIVVVDDGSTDGTQELLKGYGDRIRRLRTDHGGPSHARNAGMRASRGKYIAFLDSDDSYYPYKLSLQVEWMERHPEVGLVSTEVSGVFIDGTMEVRHLRRYHTIYEERGWEPVDVYPDREDVFFEGLGRTAACYSGDIFGFCLAGTLVMTNTLLFRREALDVAGYQNEAYRFAEDYEFVLRMCKHFRAGFIDVPTYMLRYHEGQISRFATKKTMEKRDRLQLESCNVMLAAVVDSAYADPPCYLRHKKAVDARMAELNAEIGELLRRCGDPEKGREHLRKSYEIRGRSLPMLRSWISPVVPEIWKRRLRRVRGIALLGVPIALLTIFLILWVSCGGGGGSGGETGAETPSRTVAWDPPSLFSDGSELVPSRDLSHYEIHIHETDVFLESDAPAAAVPAVDGSGNPVTSIDLSTLSPAPESGKTYYLSVRAVETNGGRSAFLLPPLRIVY